VDLRDEALGILLVVFLARLAEKFKIVTNGKRVGPEIAPGRSSWGNQARPLSEPGHEGLNCGCVFHRMNILRAILGSENPLNAGLRIHSSVLKPKTISAGKRPNRYPLRAQAKPNG
jgi:hypothetical protein